MATFTPFMQSSEAQNIINNYLGGNYNTTSTTPFRNPKFDLRTEQEAAGTLDPSALYPNPQMDFSVQEDVTVDPCPPGYQLIDGVCQPIETFGQSSYDPSGRTDDDPEERPYMSIEAMENASDEELLDYLKSGFLKNSLLGYLPSKGTEVTLGMGKLPPLFQLAFGGQNEMRKNFILSELMKRGYFTGNFDDNKNPIFDIANKNINTNVGGIESQLPANVAGEAVTDVFGDTYQQVSNDNQGNIGYSFLSGTPLPAVSQQTQGGVDYGTGRGGTSSNQITYAQQQAQQQAQQKEKERIDKVVQGIQSGQQTMFGGL